MLTTPILIMVSVINRAGCPVYHNEYGFGIDYTDREQAATTISTMLKNADTLPARNLSSVPKDYVTDFNLKLKEYDFEKAITEGWNRVIESPGEHVVKVQIGNLDFILEYTMSPVDDLSTGPISKGLH